MRTFGELVLAAERQRFSGWDFSYIHGRYEEGKRSGTIGRWSSEGCVGQNQSSDLGTGGGEFLSSLGPMPERARATGDDLRNVHEIIERSGGFEATTGRFYVIASGSESRRTVAVYAY